MRWANSMYERGRNPTGEELTISYANKVSSEKIRQFVLQGDIYDVFEAEVEAPIGPGRFKEGAGQIGLYQVRSERWGNEFALIRHHRSADNHFAARVICFYSANEDIEQLKIPENLQRVFER